MLHDHIAKYYFDCNFNCAESVLRAGNDYYELGLHDKDMILCGGFGAGMQAGLTCGAVLSAISILSMKYIEAKAHESDDIKPIVNKLLNAFNERLGSIICDEIKPKMFVPEQRCLKTVITVCDALEDVINAYEHDAIR